jgi:hypothetical protein
VVYLFLFLQIQSFAQKAQGCIKNELRSADSVILLHHLITREYFCKDEGIHRPSKYDTLCEFIRSGDVNPDITINRLRLMKMDVNNLVKLFSTPLQLKGKGFVCGCFEPMHSILIYRNGKMSYLSIDFKCLYHLEGSQNFNNCTVADRKRISALKHFFQRKLP